MPAAFHSLDFSIYQGDGISLQINIKDAAGKPIAPISSAVGRFAIGLTPDPTPLLTRDTTSNPSEIYFTVAAPQWFLTAVIDADDTVSLTPGWYYYELRLDNPSGAQNVIKSGWFVLKESALRNVLHA